MTIAKRQYKNFNFNDIRGNKTMGLNEVKKKLNDLIGNTGRLNTNIKRVHFIKNHNLLPFWESVFYYTQFLKSSASIVERLFCVKNNISEYPKCGYCKKESTHFGRNLTDGHYGQYCSTKCRAQVIMPWEFMTNETKLKKSHNLSLKLKGRVFTEQWKNKMKIAANSEKTKNKKKKTNLMKYGVENPGVLGAYSSKSSKIFIENFISKYNIDQKLCIYKNNGNYEFYRSLKLNGKFYKRCGYDFVAFKDIDSCLKKDFREIVMALEYNGPWHYTEEEVLKSPDTPSVPYKKNNPNITTIKQSYDADELKRKHIMKYAKIYIVYWENLKKYQVFINDDITYYDSQNEKNMGKLDKLLNKCVEDYWSQECKYQKDLNK